MKDWVTAGGYILAALVAGGFLLWNNRQRPHDVLKTMVEIHTELPDSPVRQALLLQIERRLDILLSRSPGGTESILERELRLESKQRNEGMHVFLRESGSTAMRVFAIVVGLVSILVLLIR